MNRTFQNSYFEERGITKDVFDEFYLGIADICAENKKILPPSILDSPAFPVYNINGSLRGYGFRPGHDTCKYLIFGFKKREQLYGIHAALPEIVKNNKVYIVEGYFDVLVAFSKGIRNVVSIFGNSLSKYQAYLLGSLTNNFVFALDNDQSGISGRDKSEELVRALLPNVNISTLMVYPHKDLADKLTYTGEADGLRR